MGRYDTGGWFFVNTAMMAFLLMRTAPAEATSCAPEAQGEVLAGIVLCIPSGEERYQVKQDYLSLFWRGDEPVPRPSKSDPPPDPPLTVAIAPWKLDLGEALAKSLLDPLLAASAAANGPFTADIPVQGEIRRFTFERPATGLLRGTHRASDKAFVVFLRSDPEGERPHLVICTDMEGRAMPNDSCLTMTSVAGKLLTIFIVTDNAERAFRISEEVISELRSFALPSEL